MKIEAYSYPSATGVCEIYGNAYTPDNDEVKAVLVINHGMAEHQERYRGFIEFMVSNGFAVYIHDMANHGKSNSNFLRAGNLRQDLGDLVDARLLYRLVFLDFLQRVFNDTRQLFGGG